MKIRTFLSVICMLLCVQLWGEEFKVGDAKYLVRPDGKVELKEYKKASGEISLPSTVTHPKSGKQYTLASIGKEAFRKSNVTKVVLPASLDAAGLGEAAFKECALLEYVELPESLRELPDEAFRGCKNLKNVNDTSIVIMGNFAYRDCDLPQWGIPASVQKVKAGVFMGNSNMKTVFVESASVPVDFGRNVFFGCPLETVIVDRNINLTDEDAYTQNRPFNNNPALRQVIVGPNVSALRQDFFEGCPALSYIQFYHLDDAGTFCTALDKANPNVNIVMDEETYNVTDFKKKVKFRKSADKYVAGVHDINNCSWLKGQWTDFNLDIIKDNITDFHQMIYDMSETIIDEWETPFPKPHCSEIVDIVADNLLVAIILENGYVPNSYSLKNWAKCDILRTEATDSVRIHDYEILLSLAEKQLKSDSDKNLYAYGLQLAGLCGLGRWQEAAAYYPKAHRLVTGNGLYAVPYEITYMRDVINEKGYKVKDPVYTKTKSTKGGKGSKGKSGVKKNDLMEYFFEKGYQKYKERRDMRRYKKWLKKTGQIK